MHPKLLDAFRRQPAYRALRDDLPTPGSTTDVCDLSGSSTSLLVATLARDLERRIFVVVATDPPEAEAVESDVEALLEEGRVALYPQREALPFEAEEHHVEVSGQRVEGLEALLAGRIRVLVTTARALQERERIPDELTDLRLGLRVGEEVRPAELAGRLEAMGFERTGLVEQVGEFAARGGIIDLYSFGAADPVRIEFWGDEISSIRHFDVLDQRSTGELERVDILPVDLRLAGDGAASRRSLLDVLPAESILVQLHAEDDSGFDAAWRKLLELHEAEQRRGHAPERPEALMLPPASVRERLAGFGRIAVRPGGEPRPPSATAAALRFDTREAESIDRDMEKLSAVLEAGAARGERTFILCDNTGQLERLEELLGGADRLPPGTSLALGSVAGGFVLEGPEPLRVLTDHEIFRRARRVRRGRRFRGGGAIESLSQLQPGDYVVHMDHGIGRFRGLERVRVGDAEIESLGIEYAGGEMLRLPIYRLDLIERWVPDREEAEPPTLHKIGGKTWKRMRQRTQEAIERMAAELLELYAARAMAERPAYAQDSRWQKELESAFLYEDTPDQRAASAAVKADMESKRPMDRLICGDVGYGKTEVAIRAAFKAAQDDRQVAVLAPTTILVEQHLHTFRERLADYPVRIEALSRFRTAKEQDAILADVVAGEVDVLIGTHRLLEADVEFHDLGLLIVDEEQRFGVRQKERFKDLKRQIDVLAMTATPIPRTLHFSLAGLRDLTLIQTPPRDRMPIITHVVPWIDEVIGDAVLRELDRGGQVFVVHNRVQSLGAVAERVKRLVPDGEVDIAHGQMRARDLDAVMTRFLDREFHVLVTTAIIENGLDVPTANTLIVDRADMFGLAQLYQLRGRVGRSHHRAFCYLVAPEGITQEAEKRLRILEHYTELGSGYAIAMKDLELRGAGNILGADQSGFVHAVGLDTYTRLLEKTVARLKGADQAEPHPAPDVGMDGPAYLPDTYLADSAQKLHLYRRLSRAEKVEEVVGLRAEVEDRFGPPPPEVDRLLDAARLRLLGQTLGLERIAVRRDQARITFARDVVPRLTALQTAMHDRQIEVEVKRTDPLSLVLHRLGTARMSELLADALALLAAQSRRAA
ncbi:MAG TPA: transcription-repair coupling factor [Longimicrobiales bacterium]|nr:transcription-repair coupling factor [Longimicrobiales bacterium]